MGSRCDADMEQGYDFDAWLGRHESKDTRPPLDKVIEALKAEGVDTFGATGYCFGGMFLSLPLREFIAISNLKAGTFSISRSRMSSRLRWCPTRLFS